MIIANISCQKQVNSSSELISTDGRRRRKVGLGNAVLHTSSSSEAWFGWGGLAPFERKEAKMRGR